MWINRKEDRWQFSVLQKRSKFFKCFYTVSQPRKQQPSQTSKHHIWKTIISNTSFINNILSFGHEMFGTKRERDRQRETDRERQTERDRQRETDRERHRQRKRGSLLLNTCLKTRIYYLRPTSHNIQNMAFLIWSRDFPYLRSVHIFFYNLAVQQNRKQYSFIDLSDAPHTRSAQANSKEIAGKCQYF